ncbi:MAG: arylsulfatase [Cyanobacteria bacterium P01_E01_bin.42]
MSGMLPWLPTESAFAQTTNPPNILVIMGDDIGWFNISAYNNGIMGYRTPNIDKIAEDGILFTDAYAENSCTAGRSAFLTGQSPARTGLTKVGLPGVDLGLSTEDLTLAEVLKEQGYATGQFGKNHLGDLPKHLPTNHGFEEFYGNLYHLNAEEEPENPDYPTDPQFFELFGPKGVLHSYDMREEDAPQTIADANALQDPNYPCNEDSQIIEELSQEDAEAMGENPLAPQVICNTGPLDIARMPTVDEEFRDAALSFMDKAVKEDGKPFFVWYNASRMHVFTHLKEESQNVTGQGIYADGMVEHDALVGDLLDKLDELGVAENTIVIYTTDNGAEVFSWPDGGMTPFHGEKNTNWEGGFRVPFVVRWPARWDGGVVSNDIISMLDWFPTLTEATGIPALENMGEQLLNPCLADDPDPSLCDLEATPPVPYAPVYHANDRDFAPLHLDGYDFLPRLDYLDILNHLESSSDKIQPLIALIPVEAPRHEFFYLSDDAYPSALRFDDWKMIFAEQREEGFNVWAEPFVTLRVPLIFNLRRDPFEIAPDEAEEYNIWRFRHAFLVAPAQAYIGQFLDTFRNYPPRQLPSSFGIDGLLEELLEDLQKISLD